MYSDDVALSLTNEHDFPVWFVVAYWGNQALPSDGVYRLGDWHDKPFEAAAYDDGKGRAVVVGYFGSDGFNALLFPPHARITFENWVVDANTPVHEWEVCQAKSLLVNGKTPLEQWLPYDVHSDRQAVISSGLHSANWRSLDFELERTGKSAAYPAGQIHFVKAELLGCFTLPAPATEATLKAIDVRSEVYLAQWDAAIRAGRHR